jgi:23S rRNA (adenine2503-C2)-methyltransferase
MTDLEKKFLHMLSQNELVAWLKEHGQPSFRAKQISEWLWKKQALTFEEMTNIGRDLQNLLAEHFVIDVLHLESKADSSDAETTKYVWKLFDGTYVESVLIRSFDRNTVCVSTQVGCPIGCTFCSSGKMGCVRNLTAAEIAVQVLNIQRDLVKGGANVTNIVYMGMGEPLRNYDEVVLSIRLLTDPQLSNFSRRRITVSTVGIVENIERLAKEDLGVNLALSLHAPTQEMRVKIIPYIRRYPLADVLRAVDLYQRTTGRDITYEYVLIHFVNDRVEDAEALAMLLKGRRGCVNLIPYNPIAKMAYKRPPAKSIAAFRNVLERENIPNTCRYTKGEDIAAACGQLAMRKNYSVQEDFAAVIDPELECEALE